jgi:hypothetical protein
MPPRTASARRRNHEARPRAAALGGGAPAVTLRDVRKVHGEGDGAVVALDAAVERRLLGPGRVIGGLLSLAAAVPLFSVSAATSAPDTAAATSQLTAICLVIAAGFLGPIAARVAAAVLGPPLARLAPVGGFPAAGNLGTATRRFSSASTPLVLTVVTDADREINRLARAAVRRDDLRLHVDRRRQHARDDRAPAGP